MTLRGRCLCGGVRFTVERAVGPFELCHCPRCRKVSGSAFVAGLAVQTRDFTLLEGRELIRSFRLPVRDRPPGYGTAFCSRCGSSVPDPPADSEQFEVPAGLLEDDPGLRPDRHIYVEHTPAWHEITDDLPRCDARQIAALRRGDTG